MTAARPAIRTTTSGPALWDNALSETDGEHLVSDIVGHAPAPGSPPT
ncbi:hypothetical protein [Microtetraspora glauca]|uniref:Uncharacterized protein n=1 Tax=Microtetraspora glauca TaxID=1996 RepID=A0ABV3GJW7_MICGL